MTSFKEQAAADITSIFINTDEFADSHDLNGTTCNCIVQSPTEQDVFLQGKEITGYGGFNGKLTIIHVPASSMPEVPCEGETFTLDGEINEVSSCIEDMGMLTITLHQNK